MAALHFIYMCVCVCVCVCVCIHMELSNWLSGKESVHWQGMQVRSLGWEDPLEEELATPSSGKSHGEWSLAGCSPQSLKKSGATEWLTPTHIDTHTKLLIWVVKNCDESEVSLYLHANKLAHCISWILVEDHPVSKKKDFIICNDNSRQNSNILIYYFPKS